MKICSAVPYVEIRISSNDSSTTRIEMVGNFVHLAYFFSFLQCAPSCYVLRSFAISNTSSVLSQVSTKIKSSTKPEHHIGEIT